MEAYLHDFVNWEQNDWVQLLPIVEFTYNNSKNTSIGYTLFKFNCGYHLRISFEDEYNACSKSFLAKRLALELRELINIYHQNFLHIQDFQKQTHDKELKSWSFTLGEKIWLNSKYIKTKKDRKFKTKFFKPFPIYHPVQKLAYKLELLSRWKIHDVFHLLLLKQGTTNKRWINEFVMLKFNKGDDKKYEVKAI